MPRSLPVLLTIALTAPGVAGSSGGDVRQGQELFQRRCALCHSTQPGAPEGAGPNLAGVVGRRAGSTRFSGYSEAMRRSELRWTSQQLDRFLTNPPDLVPGTVMVMRLADAAERSAVIAFLESLKEAPAPGPKPKRAAASHSRLSRRAAARPQGASG